MRQCMKPNSFSKINNISLLSFSCSSKMLGTEQLLKADGCRCKNFDVARLYVEISSLIKKELRIDELEEHFSRHKNLF